MEKDKPSLPSSFTCENGESDVLRCALMVAPLIKGLLGEDINVGVTDLNTYLYYVHGKAKFQIQTGDLIKPGSIAHQTIHNGVRTVAKVGKEIYGVPYIAIGYPLKGPPNDQVIGAIMIGMSVDLQEELKSMVIEIEEQINIISSTTENLSSTSEELVTTIESIHKDTALIADEVKKTDRITAMINDISEQTHLLGLNASIEAARVGDIGRGFAVVAGEIRKLSQSSQQSVREVVQTLQGVSQSVIHLAISMKQITSATQEQAALAQQINASLSILTRAAEDLKSRSNKLTDHF